MQGVSSSALKNFRENNIPAKFTIAKDDKNLNVYEKLAAALFSEKDELEKSNNIQTLALFDVELRYNAQHKIYSFKCNQFKFNQTFKKCKDFCLEIAPMKQNRHQTVQSICVEVCCIKIDTIFFKSPRHQWNIRGLYYIKISNIPENLFAIDSCIDAMILLGTKNMHEFFENFESSEKMASVSLGDGFNFEFHNKNVESNAEQAIAVKSIVTRKAFPFPYVVCGPPGTRYFENFD